MNRKKTSGKRNLFIDKWPMLKRYCVIPLVALLLVFLVFQIFHKTFFPISKVQVIDPAKRIDQVALQSTVSKDVDKGFFQVNLATIKDDILTLPWVADAQVSRKWPNDIRITIKEKQPVARWGSKSLVDSHGKIFTPRANTLPNNLPTFTAPIDAVEEVMNSYQQFQQILQPTGLTISAIEVTNRMSWEVTLSNGTRVELGRKEILQKLHRFVQIYGTIFATTSRKAQYVDMRYPNAMAVHWQNN